MYKAEYSKIYSAANDLYNASKAMNGYAQRLAKVRTELGGDFQLQGSINKIAASVRVITFATTALTDSGKCLDLICKVYSDAESSTNFFTKLVDWIKNFFRKFREQIAPKPTIPLLPVPIPGPDPEPQKPQPQPKVQPQQPPQPPGELTPSELEIDLKMYREAHAIRNDYLPRWRVAKTDEERITVLNSMLADLQIIMGTSAIPEIRVRPQGKAGQYITLDRVIEIRTDWLCKADVLRVLMHEVRHAYQAEAAYIYGDDTQHQISEERRNIWKSDYYSGGLTRSSPIEVDARWFSGGI